MSAPWEVWCTPPGMYREEDGEYSQDRRNAAQVRYLRADLTCGECEHYRTDFCVHPPKFTLPLGEPACMAFQPKEKP